MFRCKRWITDDQFHIRFTKILEIGFCETSGMSLGIFLNEQQQQPHYTQAAKCTIAKMRWSSLYTSYHIQFVSLHSHSRPRTYQIRFIAFILYKTSP